MSEPTTRFVVGKRDGGKRLDHFLHQRIPGLSRTRIQTAIRQRVSLSWGVTARPSTPVRPGGVVQIAYTPLAEVLLDVAIPILHRGVGWMAVDKPAGLPVHPVNRVRENSLIRMLRRQEECESLRLVHRLDRETTGVLLIAANRECAGHLAQQFMQAQIKKEYLALVRGVVADPRGVVDQPIGRALDSRIFVKCGLNPQGSAARTEWQVERRWDDRTLLRLFPHTGRRHQLRVHLASLGHPILGDLLYAYPEQAYLDLVSEQRDRREEDGGPRRQLLHCAKLTFAEPQSGDAMEINSPLPPDFGWPENTRD